MIARSIVSAAIAVLLVGLLGPGTAFATVKCQCNNGTLAHAMGADYDDEDVAEACDEACSSSGGGRVWSVDNDDDDDVNVRGGGERRRERPARRR